MVIATNKTFNKQWTTVQFSLTGVTFQPSVAITPHLVLEANRCRLQHGIFTKGTRQLYWPLASNVCTDGPSVTLITRSLNIKIGKQCQRCGVAAGTSDKVRGAPRVSSSETFSHWFSKMLMCAYVFLFLLNWFRKYTQTQRIVWLKRLYE